MLRCSVCVFILGLMMIHPQQSYAAAKTRSGPVRKIHNKIRSRVNGSISRLIEEPKPDSLTDRIELSVRLLEAQGIKMPDIEELSGERLVSRGSHNGLIIHQNNTLITEAEDFINGQKEAFSTTDMMYMLWIKLQQSVDILNHLTIHEKVVLLKPGTSVDDPSVWATPDTIKSLQIKHGKTKERTKALLLTDYVKKQELINQVRHFVSGQEGAFSGINAAALLKIKPEQTNFALNYLEGRGEITLLKRGTGRTNSSIWIDSASVRTLQENDRISKGEAKKRLLIIYYNKHGWPPLLLERQIRDFINRQSGAVSIWDIMSGLSINKSYQSIKALNNLYRQGEIILLQRGGEFDISVSPEGIEHKNTGADNRDYDFDIFVSDKVLDEKKAESGLSEEKVKDKLLEEYSARLRSPGSRPPRSVNLETTTGKIRSYISWQPYLFASRDVVQALGITPQRSAQTLSYLRKQDEVSLLGGSTRGNYSNVYVNPEVLEEKKAQHASEAAARRHLLDEYNKRRTIDLSTLAGKVRDYIRQQLTPFSTQDVTYALGITPQQSSHALQDLKDQNEVILLEKRTNSKNHSYIWVNPEVMQIKFQSGMDIREIIKTLFNEYDTRQRPPKPSRPLDLNQMTGQIRHYILHQSDAFTHNDVALALGITPQQSSGALRDLERQEEVRLLRQGTRSKNNPNVWADPQAVKEKVRQDNNLSENAAEKKLLDEYDARFSIDFDIIINKIRHYILKQEGAFSTQDVSENVEIRPEQSNSTLRNLKIQKEVGLLRSGTSGTSNPNMWVVVQVLDARMEHGISKDEAIAMLLHEYDTKPRQPKPINLNTIAGRLRYYLSWQLGAFSTQDVTKILGVTPQQSRSALSHLKKQNEVRLLYTGNGRGDFNIWVGQSQFDTLTAKYDLDEDKAEDRILKTYHRKIEILETLQVSIVTSTEPTNGNLFSALQFNERETDFITQTLFTLVDGFPDAHLTEEQKDIFRTLIAQHVGLGEAFLSLAESLNRGETELSPEDAFTLIWKFINIGESGSPSTENQSLFLSNQVESLAVIEFIYNAIAKGKLVSDDSALNTLEEQSEFLFKEPGFSEEAAVSR